VATNFHPAAIPGNQVQKNLGVAPTIWNDGHGVFDDNAHDKSIDLKGYNS
jgi:hypothetical protein